MISTATLSCTHWGRLPSGDRVNLYTLRNAHGMRVSISDLGATLVSWHAPDRTGRLGDILLGHDTPAEYLASTAYLGALVGRWANRIADARFTLDGIEYHLDRNEGSNLLHGGTTGFHRAIWQAEEDGDALVMRLDSEEGDAGFPGNVSVQVRYSLDELGELTIDYTATTDAPTPIGLTSHGYFNLAADAADDVRGHVMTIDADAFFEVDAQLIPVREAAVAGNAFDFREPAPLGARLDWPHAQLSLAQGFDHCYVLRKPAGAPVVREVARAYDPASGRELTVSTDQRGLQFYTGNYLAGLRGRNGQAYGKHGGLCLEAGGFPNHVNMADSETVITRPGTPYRQVTKYRLGIVA